MTKSQAFNRIQELNRLSEKALSAHDTIQELLKLNEFSSNAYVEYAKAVSTDLVLIVRDNQHEVQKLTADFYGNDS